MNMIEKSDRLRIVSNGFSFRIEFLYNKTKTWCFLAHSYIVAESYGIRPVHEWAITEFDSLATAITYIRDEYGNSGIKKLMNNWEPVSLHNIVNHRSLKDFLTSI